MLKHKVSYSVMECRSINNSIDVVNIFEFRTLSSLPLIGRWWKKGIFDNIIFNFQ